MTIDILGTDYEIIRQYENENSKLKEANGLCETWSKKIVIEIPEDDPMNVENIDAFERKVLRHGPWQDCHNAYSGKHPEV